MNFIRLIALVSLFPTLGSCAAAAAQNSLLSNSSFEEKAGDGVTGWMARCWAGKENSSTGQAWCDDVVMEQVDDPPNDTQATVMIDTGARSVPYSPMIFGGFLEHFDRQVYGGVFEPGSPLSDKTGFRRDVLAALKELKVPVVRWPGGCYVSGYHWEAGVGKGRKSTDDMAWGVVEPNTFGTDEFVELCRLLGWQPYICNNAGNGTIGEMQNWVEYCNGNTGKFAQLRKNNGYSEPRNVRIWSIGNENWGQHEIGYKPIEQWAPLVLEAAKAMKAADPNIQLSAAALPSREWTLPLLKAAGDYLDYISIHSYWLPLWQKNDMPDFLTVKRTHFHAMAMYANDLESRVGKLDIQASKLIHGNKSVSVADAIATVDESGKKWAIALVNRHPAKPVACTVQMKDRLLEGSYQAQVLAGDSPEAFNDLDNPNRVTPKKITLTFIKGAVNLPPHSLTIIKVPLE